MLIDPFLASHSRYGTGVEFRKTFSTQSSIKSKFIYSDETARGSNPRGLNFSGLYNPEIDTHRFGGFYNQTWRPDPELDLPLEFIADGRYISDNLFLREIPDSRIGDYNTQFLTSQAVARAQLFGTMTAEVRMEGNQDLIHNQNLAKQRLPEFVLSGSRSFKPFGSNPYGVKVVTSGSEQVTDFVRQNASDGVRSIFNPRVTVPFRVKNYVQGQVYTQLYQKNYSLRDTDEPTDPSGNGLTPPRVLPGSSSSTILVSGGGLSTSFERVFDIDRKGTFAQLVSLGANNSSNELVRVKNVIEPFSQYLFIPNINQSDSPQFDYLDTQRQRSLVSYGVRSRLMGRFTAPASRTRPIGELVPTLSALPILNVTQPLADFSRSQEITTLGTIGNRDGSVRDLMTLSVQQGYDLALASNKNSDLTRNPLSDITENYTFTPSDYFGFSLGGNFNTQNQQFTSYVLGLAAQDDREDLIRLRYTYTNINRGYPTPPVTPVAITQTVEGNVEIKLNERLKVGYYGRYDETQKEFQENRGLLRFSSECKCWSIDVGYSEQLNPNLKQVLMTFTLSGLGDITQSFGVFKNPNQTVTPAVQ